MDFSWTYKTAMTLFALGMPTSLLFSPMTDGRPALWIPLAILFAMGGLMTWAMWFERQHV